VYWRAVDAKKSDLLEWPGKRQNESVQGSFICLVVGGFMIIFRADAGWGGEKAQINVQAYKWDRNEIERTLGCRKREKKKGRKTHVWYQRTSFYK